MLAYIYVLKQAASSSSISIHNNNINLKQIFISRAHSLMKTEENKQQHQILYDPLRNFHLALFSKKY